MQVLIIEGLHPFFDERVAELCDYKIYLDITPEVKLAWKIQRDMKERGHSLENIKASIESRKPDFDKYIDPQKSKADLVIQVPPLSPFLSCKFNTVESDRFIFRAGGAAKMGVQWL